MAVWTKEDGHVTEDTTPPDLGANDAEPQENWEQRYIGLQKVVAKRDTELATRLAELDALRAEHEATLTQVNEFTQREVDDKEEEEARQQFESLRERFDPAPKPIANAIGRHSGKEWFELAAEGVERMRRDYEGDEDKTIGWPT